MSNRFETARDRWFDLLIAKGAEPDKKKTRPKTEPKTIKEEIEEELKQKARLENTKKFRPPHEN